LSRIQVVVEVLHGDYPSETGWALGDRVLLPAECVNVTISFETLPNTTELVHGSFVSAEWVDWGVTLSASGGSGSVLRLFDTSDPVGDTGLGSPNEQCSHPGPGVGQGGKPGELGENCEPQGNVLIIQQDNADDDTPVPNPNGGTITFDFTAKVQAVHEIALMDLDLNAITTITVKYGNDQVKTINVTGLGDNAVQTVPINLDQVSELSLELTTSGAVASISFCSTPEPPLCDPERGFLGFLGVLMATSIDNGTLDVEWEPAVFVSDNDVLPLLCEDPVYDVFLAAAPFNYTDANITELIELAASNDIPVVHIRTQDLFLNLENLVPGANFSVLVTASAEDMLYSDNRDSFDIKVSTTEVVQNRNVTRFVGTFDADDDISMLIEYDNGTSLLYFVNVVPAAIVDDVQVGYHLAVVTSDDENYIFYVTAVIDVSAAAATLMVEEAALGDLIEELDFDSVMDSGRVVNAAEALSRRRRGLKEFTLFDQVLRKEGEVVFGDFTVSALLELRAYLRVKVEISLRKRRADARITLGGSLKTEASFKWAKAVSQKKEFKQNIFKGRKVSYRLEISSSGFACSHLTSSQCLYAYAFFFSTDSNHVRSFINPVLAAQRSQMLHGVSSFFFALAGSQ
jgi:hypothetical protein